jgi:hypothetical protein
MVIRAIYERRKMEFITKMSEQSRRKAEERRIKEEVRNYTVTELAELALKHKDLFEYTKTGTVRPTSVRRALLDREGVRVGRLKSESVRNIIQTLQPDIVRKGIGK